MTPISIRLSLDELIEAHWDCQRFANRRLFVLRWFLIVPMGAGFAYWCIVIPIWLVGFILGNKQEPLDFSPAYLVSTLALFALLFAPQLRKRALRAHLQQVLAELNIEEISVRLDDDGFSSSIPYKGEYRIEWNKFDRYLETSKVFALVCGTKFFPEPNYEFFPIPKLALTDAEQQDLGSFLKSNFIRFERKSNKRTVTSVKR